MFQIRECECPKCGKIFCPAPLHVFVDGEKVYCSWHCFNHRRDGKRKARRILMFSKDGTFLKIFDNSRKAAVFMDSTTRYIQEACRTGKPYKGYLWKYEEGEGR